MYNSTREYYFPLFLPYRRLDLNEPYMHTGAFPAHAI